MPFDYSNASKIYKEFGSKPSSPSTGSTPSYSGGESGLPSSTPKTSAGKVVSGIGNATKGVFSFLGDVAKSAVKPVLSTFVQAPRAFVSGVAGLAGREDVRAEYSKPVTLPGLGEVKGLSAVPGDAEKYGTKTPQQTLGQALEMEAALIGGGAASNIVKNAGKQSLKSLAKVGVVEGAAAGALGNMGAAAQDSENTTADIVGAGFTGAALGGALGLAVPVVASGGKNIWRSMMTSKAPAQAAGLADDAAGAVDDIAKLGDDMPPPPPDGGGSSGIPSEMPKMTSDGAPSVPKAPMSSPEISDTPRIAPASTSRILKPSKNPIPLDEGLKKEALNTGFDERVVDLVDGASQTDRLKMQRMVQQAEKARKSRLVRERPFTVAGESIMERAKHVDETRKQAGQLMGEAVKNMPKDPIDMADVRQQFVDALKEDGVTFGFKKDAAGAMDLKRGGDTIGEILDGPLFEDDLNFAGARYANDKASQKIIKQLYSELSSNRAKLPPQQVWRMRQRLFDDLDLGKQKQALTGRVQSLLEDTRTKMDQPLQALSPEYAKYSQQYAQMIGALQDFYSGFLGRNFSHVEDDIAKLRVGEVGARIAGNASANGIRILDQLEKAAIDGGMEVTDDVARQFFFADMLDDLFEITQTRGFQGGVERGTQKGLENTIVQNAGLGMKVATGKFGDATGELVQRVMGKTREDQQELLKKIIGLPYKERDVITKMMGN